jgi:hypothetical protein
MKTLSQQENHKHLILLSRPEREMARPAVLNARSSGILEMGDIKNPISRKARSYQKILEMGSLPCATRIHFIQYCTKIRLSTNQRLEASRVAVPNRHTRNGSVSYSIVPKSVYAPTNAWRHRASLSRIAICATDSVRCCHAARPNGTCHVADSSKHQTPRRAATAIESICGDDGSDRGAACCSA